MDKLPADILAEMSDQELISLLQKTGGPIVVELSKRGVIDVRVCRLAAFEGDADTALKAVLTYQKAA